jgi:apolipoprotein N-acyltransferase
MMALMFLMPLFAGLQRSRFRVYSVAVAYYSGASWALIPAARNFLGPSVSSFRAVGFWLLSATLLASPFALVWTDRRKHMIWRLPLGSVINTAPPLGIIGWASPLTSAGLLFPGTGWLGLIIAAALPGLFIIRPRMTSAGAAILVLVTNLLIGNAPPSPIDWRAVDTDFGGVAHDSSSLVAQFTAAERIQEVAKESRARVVVFPETVVPVWTEAARLFWQQTLDELRASGKTILVGVGMPVVELGRGAPLAAVGRYRNVVLIAGAESGVFSQRIPVPLGMWRPLSNTGVPLNLLGKGTDQIAGMRVAVLICYEQLLSWPVLQSILERPSVVVAIANDYWAKSTPIPQCQAASVKSWARLFHLPALFATNR